MGYVFFGVGIFCVLAIVVVVVGLQRFNRPKCPQCGLSVNRDLSNCPYCHAQMRPA